MSSQARAIAQKYRLALIAHDQKKDEMVAFVTAHAAFLSTCSIFATGTTGRRILEACPGLT